MAVRGHSVSLLQCSLFVAILAFYCIHIEASTSKYVRVDVKSNWLATSLVQEMSEFFAQDSNDLFWSFVDELGQISDLTTEKDQYTHAVGKTANLLSPIQRSLFNYSMSLRYFSPKVQAYRQISSLALSTFGEDVKHRLSQASSATVLSTDCKNWVIAGSKLIENEGDLKKAIDQSSSISESSQIYDFDHVYPSSSISGPVFFLYGCIGTPQFTTFHNLLKSNSKNIRYVLRHSVPAVGEPMNLAGYGVELALKSLEYKAVDDTKVEGSQSEAQTTEEDEEEIQGFLFGTLQKRKPQYAAELATLKSFLLANTEQFEDLKVWTLKDIAFSASQRIVTASDPLKLLRDISQNFPTVATSLSKVKLNNTLKQQLTDNGLVEPGRNIILINGRMVDIENTDPYELYNVLREESFKLNSLVRLHLSEEDVFKILSLPPAPEERASFKIHNKDAIVYVNDLEKEPSYAQFGRSVNDMFRRVWPGSFRYIAKNLFTAVLVIEPSHPSSLGIASFVSNVINQNAPIRFGFIFSRGSGDNRELNTKFIKAFNYIKDASGPREALAMFAALRQSSETLDESSLAAVFNQFARRAARNVQLNDIAKETTYDEKIQKTEEYLTQMGLSKLPLGFVNGIQCEGTSAEELIQSAMNQYFTQTNYIQELIQKGVITNNVDIYDTLMNQPSTYSRFNVLVLSPTDSKFVSLAEGGITATALSNIKYISNRDSQDTTKSITHLVAVDLSTPKGVKLASEAVKSLEGEATKHVRVGLLHFSSSQEIPLISRAIIAAQQSQIQSKALTFISQILTSTVSSEDDVLQAASSASLNVEKFKAALKAESIQTLVNEQQAFCVNTLKLKKGDSAVITNGRVIVVPDEISFDSGDFDLLTSYEYQKRAKKVEELFTGITLTGIDSDQQTSGLLSDVLMKSISVLGVDEQKGIEKIAVPSDFKSTLTINSGGNPLFNIIAILDPLSAATQRFSPMLEVITRLFPVKLDLILNPTEHSNLPLKNFYSYAIDDELEFDSNGKAIGSYVVFHHLPSSRLLTMNLDTPQSWLITPTVAKYDLDNIKLDNLGSDRVLSAEFELEHLMLQGNCLELFPNGRPIPPRGLEIVLGDQEETNKEDTLVMSNLGYFQLKANPGVWSLRLKPSSRSSDLYEIKKGDNVEEAETIVIADYSSAFHPLKVAKKAGKEQEVLLEDSVQGGVWNSITGILSTTKGGKKAAKSEDTIHVFSLASGHLYERFLKIMMLSAVKNTKAPVKFWLLANFLSPQFKDSIPALADKYNFEYELVTYKWPAWLFKQTEKQRIIWAYKILFLDVLFPIDLKKVIYVDADQVVRSDLQELWDMDLKGAPYAYTPFCEGNKDTEGFRFWKQGFWNNHLRGLPYHISALYVVDLARFRRLAAGDQLRATYSQLAPDPNSLANLDQDLPNYLQHQVKIFSLPQEWLWCETWCSNDTKSNAKTIDLCNNPLTKTPKLENAVRIIDEWTQLDNEAKAADKEVQSQSGTNGDDAQKVLSELGKQIV